MSNQISNQIPYTHLLIDLPPEQQELLSGGKNSDDTSNSNSNSNSDGDFYKDKDKYKYKDKDKDITNLFNFEKEVYGQIEINLTVRM